MDPGEFDTRIQLIRLDETGRDAAGAPTVTRVEVARPWAKLTYPGGREFLSGEGEVTERKVVIRLYARADVDTDTVVVAKGQDHDIKDIRPFDDVMELHAVARAPGQAS
ncbi:phage head closure protein [Brevundimonas sp.]